jgi:hypothetical protein
VDPKGRTLYVTATPAKLDEIAGILQKLDRPSRQIVLDIRVVEFSDDAALDVEALLNSVSYNWWFAYSGWGGGRKPVICLYPEKTTDVSVKLDYRGTLEYTWPVYDDGWRVTAHPDGTLINHADGEEYSYLFWEGRTNVQFDLSRGFVVRGADTATFLREKLAFMGLTPREYNEFIVYWLPLMRDNAWNLISFQGKAYTDNAVLTIDPKPDSVLRIYMTYKPLESPLTIPPQELTPFVRKGFTVVEWGGGAVR